MKRLRTIISAAMILLLLGCADQNVQTSGISGEIPEASADTSTKKSEYNIIGEYICKGEIYDQFKEEAYEYIPSINFYEDGSCRLWVYYIGVVTGIRGIYNINENKIYVHLDFDRTVFENSGDQYMDDEYIFTITEEDQLIIDRGFYVVNAEDLFVRTSTEPENTTEAEYDIIGKYICNNDYYNDEYISLYLESVSYVTFYEYGHCKTYIDYLEGGQEVWGKYSLEGNQVKVALRFFPTDEPDPIRENMDDEYVFTIIDEDHLVIDKGYFAVQAGDSFVKVSQGDS